MHVNLPRATLVAPLIASLCFPVVGCGLFRRSKISTNVSSNVEINEQGRDLATLTRDEYEIIETSIGEDKQVGVFVFTLPVGQQTTKEEGAASAYYAAVDRIPECDALMSPRVSVKRTLIPFLLINIVIRKTRVKGRCAHFIGERDGVVNERGSVPPETQAPAQVEAESEAETEIETEVEKAAEPEADPAPDAEADPDPA